MGMATAPSIDTRTVESFGEEWSAFDQTELSESELQRRFAEYFDIFPLDRLANAEGFDLGCGSGRWDVLLAPRVGKLHCIDPAFKALAVARHALREQPNVAFHQAAADTLPFADASMDFGVCIGVLHHTPNPAAAMASAAAKLKPGAPFLVYLYYSFENRPLWFRAVWKAADLLRRAVHRLPGRAKRAVCDAIAAIVYWPLARGCGLLERLGVHVDTIPLAHYRNWSFYSMRTDALDRFGTPIEHRFTRAQVQAMMERAGLRGVRFREGPPYWVACGFKH